MKKVLCFGDSNTYGFIPGNGQRYDENIRWTGVLQKLSEGKFEIIEAGCNNRTGFFDNPAGMKETGYKILPLYLSKKPDFVILAIGVNDLQTIYNASFYELKSGIENLIDIVRDTCPDAKIIVASPPVITNALFNGYFSSMFDKNSIEKSKQIGTIFKKAAKSKECTFVDLNDYIVVSEKDGLHYEPEAHKEIAVVFFQILENLTIYS